MHFGKQAGCCLEAAHQLFLSLGHCRSHTLVALMGQDTLKGPKGQRHRGGCLHPCIPGDSSLQATTETNPVLGTAVSKHTREASPVLV